MPGIQDGNRGLAAGLTAQPLVTSAAPVVTPDAVTALTDGFRSGMITSQDILDRVGELGRKERAAKTQQFNEFIDPNNVASRNAQMQAAGAQADAQKQVFSDPTYVAGMLAKAHADKAQADLITTQANAGQALVGPQTQLSSTTLGRQEADARFGTGIDTYQKTAALYGLPPMVQKDGRPDWDTMGMAGLGLEGKMGLAKWATQMLQPAYTLPTKGPGVAGVMQFNSMGQEITPGSPSRAMYQRLATMAAPDAFRSVVSPEPAATPAAQASPAVNPSTLDSAQRADLVNSLAPSGASDEALTNAVHQSLGTAPIVVPANPAPAASPKPVIEPQSAAPASTPQTGTYKPGFGMVTEITPGNFGTEEAIRNELNAQPVYQYWNKQKPLAKTFLETARRVNGIPLEQQSSMTKSMHEDDIALAEAVIKMYDPGNAIRPFKWDKLEQNQPYWEQVKNWRATLGKTGTFTPPQRKRVMEMGYDSVRGAEMAVTPQVQAAAERLKLIGKPANPTILSDEMPLLSGTSTVPANSADGAPAQPASKTITLRGQQYRWTGPGPNDYAPVL